MPPDVQPGGDAPAESQGSEATDSGLIDLDSVAPEVREMLEPHIKAINGNVDKRFREAADYKKQWQPYEELGLGKNIQPDELKGLLDFAQMANDPEQFGQWWQNAGKEMGLFDKFAENDELDLDDLEDDFSPEKIQELIEKQVADRISPIEQTLEQQQEQEKAAKANEEVKDALAGIRNENSDLFEGDEEHQEKVQQRIARLAYSYSEDESLSLAEMFQKGLEDYKEMIGQGEKGLFAQKSSQPKPPEGAGAADNSPEKLSNEWGDPTRRAIALEKLKQAS